MKLQAYFATCPRGLEALLEQELRAIGAQATRALAGGVSFEGDTTVCYRANLESRLASRLLLRLAHAPYRNEHDIYEAAHAIRWHDCFRVSDSIRVDLTAARSPLKSLEFATLRIKDAVCDRFRAETGRRPDVDTRSPAVRIAAFVDSGHASFYLDTSGEPLYKRGYRTEPGEAPLKENLAAGVIRLSGWQADEPLLDPMCGSGTLLAEAAMIALDVAPGSLRGFGFERLAQFDSPLWLRLKAEAQARRAAPRRLAIFGSDISGRELARARENLAQIGLPDVIELKQGNALDVSPPAPAGVMIANPPYGVRLGDREDMSDFYPKFGDALKKKFAGWRCHVLSADPALARGIRLHASKRTPLFNGPLECRLYEYKIIAGSMRREKSPGAAKG